MTITPSMKLGWLKQVLRDPETGPMDFVVAFLIEDHVNNKTGRAWPGKLRLSKLAKASPKTMQRAIRKLGLLGHLRVIRVPSRTNIYELNRLALEIDSAVLEMDTNGQKAGRAGPQLTDSGVHQTYREPIELNGVQGSRDILGCTCASSSRLAAWKWGTSERLVESARRSSYEPFLLERLGAEGRDIVKRLPQVVLEHLLQRVREGSLTTSDICEARRIASHVECRAKDHHAGPSKT